MVEFMQNWGALLGYFLCVGLLLEATKRTIGAKAGDPGFKGFFYVWKRVLVLPLGAGLGALGSLVPIPTALGEGLGYGVLTGLLGAGAVALAYDQVVGSLKSRVKHLAAKSGS
jgi:hypothetical protein